MRSIDKIVMHCTDSGWGDARVITHWHTDPPPRGRGWSAIGYHYVILNGYRTPGLYRPQDDGLVEEGRPLHVPGAHVKGHNSSSVGVALVGTGGKYTVKQLLSSVDLVWSLMQLYGLGPEQVYAHHQFDTGKTCPDFSILEYRTLLKCKER